MEKSNQNKINVYSSLLTTELKVSTPDVKQVISTTNNRAQYYAEQAKKYRDEAKNHRDNAKFYAEQNSDVTLEYIENVKNILENKLALKQDAGDYLLSSDIPTAVSAFENDALYVNQTELNNSIDEIRLPSLEGFQNSFLKTDGENLYWARVPTPNKLFDTTILDYALTYEESQGWALQGTYVYRDAIAGSRYGYADFYNKVLEEKEAGTPTEVTLGENTITMYINTNGHQYYDISDKDIVDSWFELYGYAWFYGVDTENKRVFLPRNNYFEQMTCNINEVGQGVEAGLPNITGYVRAFCADTIPPTGPFTLTGDTSTIQGGTKNKLGINFDASNCSSVYGKSNTVQPNAVKKLLYICVGNTTNFEAITDIVNQGMEILEQVNQGLETRVCLDGSNAEFAHIIETYRNGTSWYRIYSDGWCEQGGIIPITSTALTTVFVHFLIQFKDTNYTLMGSLLSEATTTEMSATNLSVGYDKSLTGFTSSLTKNSNGQEKDWMACGYIA